MTRLTNLAKATVLLALLSACKEDPRHLYVWDSELAPYMSELGYTIGNDGVTILKNNVPMWQQHCGRGCNIDFLAPLEFYSNARDDIDKALRAAREQYLNDFSEKIEIKPTGKENVNSR